MKKLSKILFSGLFLGLIFSIAGATPALAVGGLQMFAKKLVPKSTMIVDNAFYTSVDVSALAAYAGDYEQQLYSTLVNELDIAADIRVYPNIKNKKNLTKLTANANAKPFISTEEYAGKLDYTPRTIEVKQGKTELLIDLEDYRDEWMADQMGVGSHANKGAQDIPFAQYTWSEVMRSLAAEINDRTSYFGFDSSGTAAWAGGSTYSIGDRVTLSESNVLNYYEAIAATSAGESPTTTPAKWKKVNAEAIAKGLGAIIAEEITATDLVPFGTGSVTSGADALAAQRALFRSLPESYKKLGVTLYQSYTDYEFLMDGIEDKITKYTKEDNTPVFLPGTDRKCMVKPATWLSGSRRLIATPANNMLLGTDLLSDMNQIKVLEGAKLWTMPVGIKFGIGFQIRDLDALAIGDQS